MSKILSVLLLFTTLFISGCSCNKNNIIKEINNTQQEIEQIEKNKEQYDDSNKILEFYNKLSRENTDSLVVVKSVNKFTNASKYTNGIVVSNTPSQYYVLFDYASISQQNEKLYVMDAYGYQYEKGLYGVGDIKLYSNNRKTFYDPITGLGILLFSIRVMDNPEPNINSISIGNYSDIYAYCNSIEQYNKVQVFNNIKSSTMAYEYKDYTTYDIENVNEANGSLLINFDNKLFAIYSSRLNCFIDSNLIQVLFG